jgi:Zn-dependent protease with chaperone function
MRRALMAFALLTGASLAACSLAGDDAASQEADHTAGEPTFSQESWLWADESVDEFRAYATMLAAQPGNWMGPADFLPFDHPMSQRLQVWTDRIDSDLRTRYPEKLRGTPRPRIILRKSAELNAWVSALPVAWKVKTRVAGEDDAGTTTPDADADADIDIDGGADAAVIPTNPAQPAPELYVVQTGDVWTGFGDLVFDRPHDAQKVASFVRFHNENFAKCRLESTGDEIVFSELCAPPPGGLTNRRAEKLAYYATSTYVTFTTGYILRMLTEDRVVATLAHELGHFYRSHVNMPTDVVNYFYSLDQAHAHMPQPDPRTIEQTARVREKIRNGETDYAAENALMKERNLGFYTTEQEADEIALEILANIGLPPNIALEVDLEALKWEEESSLPPLPGEIPYAECMMLRDQAFRDADGKVVSVPVGDPNNAHHNSCFRVFNMLREIQAHRYQLGPRPPVVAAEWSALIAQLGSEVPSAPPAAPDAGVANDASAPPIADAGTD